MGLSYVGKQKLKHSPTRRTRTRNATLICKERMAVPEPGYGRLPGCGLLPPMPLERILDRAPCPGPPATWQEWPSLERVTVHKGEYTFHYSNGIKRMTRDREEAEAISRMFFPTGPKSNG